MGFVNFPEGFLLVKPPQNIPHVKTVESVNFSRQMSHMYLRDVASCFRFTKRQNSCTNENNKNGLHLLHSNLQREKIEG